MGDFGVVVEGSREMSGGRAAGQWVGRMYYLRYNVQNELAP